MKKLLLGFILGNAFVAWLVGKVFGFIYRAAPEPFDYIGREIIVPTCKNIWVDTVEHFVERLLYGVDGRPERPSVTNYTPYQTPHWDSRHPSQN